MRDICIRFGVAIGEVTPLRTPLVLVGRPSPCMTSHPGQLSLAIPRWVEEEEEEEEDFA